MLKIGVYNQSGEATGEVNLSQEIFGLKPNPDIVRQVVEMKLAGLRKPIAHTKTKGEVRGGGKKPWKQKGTGRARAGSIRSPLWKGGGVTFGPRSNVNFTKKVNKKMERKALFMVLSDKLSNNKLVVVDKFIIKNIKTKDFLNNIIKKLPSNGEKTLILNDKYSKGLFFSARNLPLLKINRINNISLIDLLNYSFLIITKGALKVLEETYKKA